MRFIRCEIVGTLALVILASVIVVTPFPITLKEGGYQDIFVGIHRSVPEDEIIIENIKKMFISGSKYLFSATGHRLYFRDVTFILPETWTENHNLTSIFSDFYPQSHIRIAQPNPEFGDAPYTLQPGECGDRGQYIHLTPKFVINKNGETFQMFGDPGKQLVHEWGHLRFGVFDEYGSAGDRRFPPFYLEGGKIRPSCCIKDIKGWIEREDGQPCTVYENNVVGDDCFFYPSEEKNGQTLKASIMFLPYLPTMVSFCEENTEDLTKKHNSRAPTKHNVFCKYKSTWEIISKHPDLSSKILANDTKTEPNFHMLRYVGNQDRKVVLVMDHSGSMGLFNRIDRMNNAVRRYIWDILPLNFSLGMVIFSDVATKLTTTLVRLTDDTVRKRLSDLLPPLIDGQTSIGSGLLAAIQILKENGGKTEGASIILVTDGEENKDPRIFAFEQALKDGRIIVNTIAMGGSAEKYLEHLAFYSGGSSYHIPDSSPDASNLDSAFISATSNLVDLDFQPVTLVNQALTVTDGKIREVTIDNELGKNTEFTFRGKGLKEIRVGLTSPDGKEYDETSPEFNDGVDLMQRKRFFFQMAKAGKWLVKFNVSGTAGVPVTFNLISEVLDTNNQPVRVKSWLDKVDFDFPAYVKVFAQVNKGSHIIINATVHAVIVRPNETDYPLVLKDNGAGADSIKDDGIYSNKFRAFSGDDRYSVVATVINDGNAQIKIPGPNSGRIGGSAFSEGRRTRGGGGGANNDNPPVADVDATDLGTSRGSIPEPQLETVPANVFERRNDLGDFLLRHFTPGESFSPDRVTDLKVEYVEPPTSVNWQCKPDDTTGIIAEIGIQLKWTAVVNGVDDGNVSGVEIRGSLNGDDLLTNFKKGRLMVLNKTWSPLKPGEIQRAKLVLPRDMILTQRTKKTADIYFALISVNGKGLSSDMSNIASAHLGYTAKNNDTSTMQSDEQETNIPTNKLSDNKIGLIIGIVLAGLILGALVIVLFKFLFQKDD